MAFRRAVKALRCTFLVRVCASANVSACIHVYVCVCTRRCLRVFSQLLGFSRAIYSFHSAQSGLRSKITDRKGKHQADPTHAHTHTHNPRALTPRSPASFQSLPHVVNKLQVKSSLIPKCPPGAVFFLCVWPSHCNNNLDKETPGYVFTRQMRLYRQIERQGWERWQRRGRRVAHSHFLIKHR